MRAEVFSQKLAVDDVNARLDFGSSGIEAPIALAQLDGTTALYNTLCDHRVAYLADEVGMGKTYQALGVMTLAWMFSPQAKVLVLAPNQPVQHKWSNDYRQFLDANVKRCGGRVRDVLIGSPVHTLQSCDNLNDLCNALLANENTLCLARLSSFSHLAGSMGIDPEKTKTSAEVADRLRKLKFHVPEPPETIGPLSGSLDVNEEAARQLSVILPRFDFIIVDEAHRLRNRGGNIFTKVMAWLLGLRPPSAAASDEPTKCPAVLMLSATPAHRAEQDIYNQLAFVRSDADTIHQAPNATREAYLKQFFVRRLRLLHGQSKYDYRREQGQPARAIDLESGRLDEELFFVLAQKRLEEALAAQEKRLNNRIKIGFLECFESYEAGESNVAAESEDEEGAATHTDVGGETHAPDYDAMRGLVKQYQEDVGGVPPHPKQRLIEETFRDSLRAHPPEKLLIFVRRRASVRELVHRISRVYDDEALRRLELAIGPERIREVLDGSSPAPSPEEAQFRSVERFARFANNVLGREGDADVQEVEVADEDEDAELSRSQVLEVFASRRTSASASNRFRQRFNADRPLSGVFEENRVRHLFELIEPGGQGFLAFLDTHYDVEFDRAVQWVLQKDQEKEQPLLHLRTPGGVLRPSRVRSLLHELFLARFDQNRSLPGPWGEHARQLLHIIRVLQGQKTAFPKAEEIAAVETSMELRDKLMGFLRERSVWDWLRGWSSEHLSEDGQVLRHKLRESVALEEREFLKNVLDKNLRISDGVLDVFIAFVRSDHTVDEVSKELAKQLFGAGGKRTLWRLAETARLYPQVKNLLSGQTKKKPLYTETTWPIFNQQDPVLGVMGGSSSRTRAIVQFNIPFFPDVLVTTDVFREGVDLHLSCRRVWHFGMASTPGDIEQRTGRIDRYFSKVHRALKHADGRPDSTLEVGYPYLTSSVDEQQLARTLRRKLEVQPLLDSGVTSIAVQDGLDIDEKMSWTVDELFSSIREMKDHKLYAPFWPESQLTSESQLGAETETSREELASKFVEELKRAFQVLWTQGVLSAEPYWLDETNRLDRPLFLTNVTIVRDGDRARVVTMPVEGVELRDQPLRVQVFPWTGTELYLLRISTPLGQHPREVAQQLTSRLWELAPTAPCSVHFHPAENSVWQVEVRTELPFSLKGNGSLVPSITELEVWLVRVAKLADDLEFGLSEAHSDIPYADALTKKGKS